MLAMKRNPSARIFSVPPSFSREPICQDFKLVWGDY